MRRRRGLLRAGTPLLFVALLTLWVEPAGAVLPPPPTIPPLPVGPLAPVIDDVEDTVGGLTNTVDDGVDGTLEGLTGGSGGLPALTGPSVPPTLPATPTDVPAVTATSEVLTESTATQPDGADRDATSAQSRPATAGSGEPFEAAAPPAPVGPASTERPAATTSVADRVADVAEKASRHLEVAVAFLVAVLTYLVVQDRATRRDPKLAHAPVSRAYVRFR